MDPLLLRAIADRLEAGDDVVLITVIDRQGSAPATPGQKLLLTANGVVGSVGGGNLEHEVLAKAREMLGKPAVPLLWNVRLGPDLGMCCGGAAQMVIESYPAPKRAWVAGGGHVAHALAPLLLQLGYRVTVTDARPEWAMAERFPGCEVLELEADEVPFAPGPRDVALVMTHDHRLDELALAAALAVPFAFVGGVGSRAKAARIKNRLRQKGVDDEMLARMQMPVGLDIGARLPAEIAVAIAGELIARHARRPAKTPAPVGP